jgi:hypothetical protein
MHTIDGTAPSGLSEREAAARLAADGANELPQLSRRTLTLNRMTVAALLVDGRLHDIDYEREPAPPETFHALVAVGNH